MNETLSGPKEAWEITRAEFLADATGVDEIAIKKAAHANHVRDAVKEGKPVSLATLASCKNNGWAQIAIEDMAKATLIAKFEDLQAKHPQWIYFIPEMTITLNVPSRPGNASTRSHMGECICIKGARKTLAWILIDA